MSEKSYRNCPEGDGEVERETICNACSIDCGRKIEREGDGKDGTLEGDQWGWMGKLLCPNFYLYLATIQVLKEASYSHRCPPSRSSSHEQYPHIPIRVISTEIRVLYSVTNLTDVPLLLSTCSLIIPLFSVGP